MPFAMPLTMLTVLLVTLAALPAWATNADSPQAEEICDSTDWVCKDANCQCVRDTCDKTPSSVHGHCKNHKDWPCTNNKDAVCVCKTDKSKKCEPRVVVPPKTPIPCDKNEWSCPFGNCGCVRDRCTISTGSVRGHCANHKDWTCKSDNDAVCVCEHNRATKCTPVTPAPPPSGTPCDSTHTCVTKLGRCNVKCCSKTKKCIDAPDNDDLCPDDALECTGKSCDKGVCKQVPVALPHACIDGDQKNCQCSVDGTCVCPDCGNGVAEADKGEECDAGSATNSNSDQTIVCDANCKLKFYACCADGACTQKKSSGTKAQDIEDCGDSCNEAICAAGITYKLTGQACTGVTCPAPTPIPPIPTPIPTPIPPIPTPIPTPIPPIPTPTPPTLPPAKCGDGEVNQASEKCDEGANNDNSDDSESFCTEDCELKFFPCCGKTGCSVMMSTGIADDDSTLCTNSDCGAIDCSSLQYSSSDTECSASAASSCDTDIPPVCGNGVVETGEDCDIPTGNSDVDGDNINCNTNCHFKFFACCAGLAPANSCTGVQASADNTAICAGDGNTDPGCNGASKDTCGTVFYTSAEAACQDANQCPVPQCGDGTVDQVPLEECDLGDATNSNAAGTTTNCDTTCSLKFVQCCSGGLNSCSAVVSQNTGGGIADDCASCANLEGCKAAGYFLEAAACTNVECPSNTVVCSSDPLVTDNDIDCDNGAGNSDSDNEATCDSHCKLKKYPCCKSGSCTAITAKKLFADTVADFNANCNTPDGLFLTTSADPCDNVQCPIPQVWRCCKKDGTSPCAEVESLGSLAQDIDACKADGTCCGCDNIVIADAGTLCPASEAPCPSCGDGCLDTSEPASETCDFGASNSDTDNTIGCDESCHLKAWPCCKGAECNLFTNNACAGATTFDLAEAKICCQTAPACSNSCDEIKFQLASDQTCTPTCVQKCGDHYVSDPEECEQEPAVAPPNVIPCDATCKKRYFVCCNGETCVKTQTTDIEVDKQTCATVCGISTDCNALQYVDSDTECNLECAKPCEDSAICGPRPGCDNGPFQFLECGKHNDCGDGNNCIKVKDACNADSECRDCNDNGGHKHMCKPCIECTEEQMTHSSNQVFPNALVCCPVPVVEQMKRSAKHNSDDDDDDCPLEESNPATCRQKLNCMCGKCLDSCDFTVSGDDASDQTLGEDLNGVAINLNFPDVATELTGSSVTDPRDTLTTISTDMCKALHKQSCHLHPSFSIEGAIDAHEVTAGVKPIYNSIFYDVYEIHASDRLVKISITFAADNVAPSLPERPLLYLIDFTNDCATPNVIVPQSRRIPAESITNVWTFLVPKVGDYGVVLSMALQKVILAIDQQPAPVTDYSGIRCNDYTISVQYTPPECPSALCDLESCVSPQDCPIVTGTTQPCSTDFHRCILAKATGDRHAIFVNRPYTLINSLPSGNSPDRATQFDDKEVLPPQVPEPDDPAPSVCAGIADNTACIYREDGHCVVGRCDAGVCSGGPQDIDFECDCACPRQCKNTPDCKQQCVAAHDNTYTGFCIPHEGTCVCHKKPPAPAPAPSPEPAPVPSPLATQEIVIPVQLVGFVAKSVVDLQAPRIAQVEEPVSDKCVLSVMDETEIQYTILNIKAFGSAFSVAVANLDSDERNITVVASKNKPSNNCCARVDIPYKCLDGNTQLTESGHLLLDRTWRMLNNAPKNAQAGQSLSALEDACCALTYFNAMNAWIGGKMPIDSSTTTVVRDEDGVGPARIAFDDGHNDNDVNDVVYDQRSVEIRDSKTNVLIAVNVHVEPLARGGGYRASYAISLRGTSIESIDRGANAACSERARAVISETYDPASIASVLRNRAQFPEGTQVSVYRHVIHSRDGTQSLPVGVRGSQCTQLGGQRSDDDVCDYTDRGDVALFENTKSALPPVQGDAIDRLLSQGIRVDQSTNTYHNAEKLRAIYGAGAVILPAKRTAQLDSSSVRYVLRNEDCGSAVLLLTPTEQRQSQFTSPLAVRIPPHSAAAWSHANEGVRLVRSPDDTNRVCRGGTDSGITECTTDNVCQQGACAQPAAIEGVPYKNAQRHFECRVCYTEDECNNEASCKNHECCAPEVLYWYRYPTPELVYAGKLLDIRQAILNQQNKKKK